MGFFNWSILLPLLPLIPILVGLYFLKLKRPVREIPSILLWQKVLEDEKVNSPFQKFKHNLLLIIQLLLLLILIMAAMQPFWKNQEAGVQRQVIAIDTSASMATIQKSGDSGKEDATTSFDLAIEQTKEIIERLEKDQQIALISFSQDAQQHVGFTNDRRKLLRALDEIKLNHVEGDLKPALELMNGLAKSATIDRVHLISDGNFESETAFDLPFPIRYTPPSGESAGEHLELINLGIIHFSAQREENGITILARLKASRRPLGDKSLVSARVTLSEIKDGQPEVLKSQVTNWDEGEAISLMFELPLDNSGSGQDKPRQLSLAIEPQQPDSLLLDNQSYLSLGKNSSLKVTITDQPASFKAFFRRAPELSLVQATESSPANILINPAVRDDMTEIHPLASTMGTVIHIKKIPGDLTDLIKLEGTDGSLRIVDWRRDDPVLRYVDLREIVLMDQAVWHDNPGFTVIELSGELAKRGYQSLIEGPKGPLLLKKSIQGQLHYFFLFDPDRTTLPYQLALPLLLTNVINQQRLREGGGSQTARPTGILTFQHDSIQAGQRFTITPPTSSRDRTPKPQELTSDTSGELTGIKASRPGQYTIKNESTNETHLLYASLISEQETSLTAADKIKFNDQQVVTVTAAEIPGNKPLWHWVIRIGLLILVVEWWFFNTPGARRKKRLRDKYSTARI